MKNNVPVLIPIKHFSQRCPDKNRVLLPYTIQFLERVGKLENAVVITDSYELMELALSFKINTHYETRDPNQDEFVSCSNYLAGKEYSKFFLCPVTQPFRSSNLVMEMEQKYQDRKDSLDFVCSVTSMPNRDIFHVVEKDFVFSFKKKSKIRKGANCEPHLMIDGALYLINTHFLSKVIQSKNTNAAFWSGRFTCALNTASFIDIDTKADMSKFEFLHSFFNEANRERKVNNTVV